MKLRITATIEVVTEIEVESLDGKPIDDPLLEENIADYVGVYDFNKDLKSFTSKDRAGLAWEYNRDHDDTEITSGGDFHYNDLIDVQPEVLS